MKTFAEAAAIVPKHFKGRGSPCSENEPTTIAELFRRSLKEFGRPNLFNYKCDNQWKQLSSQVILKRIEDIALGLYAFGLRLGDKAAIIAANSPEWTLTDGGCQFSGIVNVPIYTTLAANAVGYIVNDSDSKLIFIENRAMYNRIADALAECPKLEKIVIFDATDCEELDVLSLKELEAAGELLRISNPTQLDEFAKAESPDNLATLIYTSGTTGEPKGVMLTQTNVISNVIDGAEKYHFEPRDVPLSVLPLSHIFERSAMYVYISHGMAIHFAESIEKVPDNLKEVRPTLFVGVPRIFEKVFAAAKLRSTKGGRAKEQIFDWAIEIAKKYAIYRESEGVAPLSLRVQHQIADKLVFEKFREVFGGRLRSCITGGAALSDDIYLIFNGAGVEIMQGYGLTETSPVLSSNNRTDFKLGTVGKPIRNVQIRIATDGEIEAYGPGIMIGYYNKAQATRDAFTEDGWFKTGDIGSIDGEGFLKITDRKKELFKTSGGKYIAPSPIEQMIRASRFVNQVVLVGNERKFPAALVVPNFEQLAAYAEHKGLSLANPREFCQSEKIINLIERQIDAATKNLSQFEKVKKIALIEQEFSVDGGELTPTLKVKRRVVDDKYKTIIDAFYD